MRPFDPELQSSFAPTQQNATVCNTEKGFLTPPQRRARSRNGEPGCVSAGSARTISDFVRWASTPGAYATGLAFLFTLVILNNSSAAEPRKPDFLRDIRPIFSTHCVSCHGDKKQKAGLRLDRRPDALLAKIIKPGFGAESKLFQLVVSKDDDERMPQGAVPLTPGQIAILKAWIDQGAKWPSSDANHWSLRPLKSPAIPKAAGANPIDAFIRAKLAEKGFKPSPPADKRTLIRRLTFDLHGLPPTPEEIEAFVTDTSPDAYERLVDRLLASPRYGERWARHWMDIAHFAETHGHDQDCHPRERLAVSRLSDSLVQRRQAIREVRPGADRRRCAVPGRSCGHYRPRLPRRRPVGREFGEGHPRRHDRQEESADTSTATTWSPPYSLRSRARRSIALAATITSSTRSHNASTTACKQSSRAWSARTARMIPIPPSRKLAVNCWPRRPTSSPADSMSLLPGRSLLNGKKWRRREHRDGRS